MTANYPSPAVMMRWYAQPNDLIGGWCITLEDKPPSQNATEVATFIDQDTVEHMVELHNAWLQTKLRHGAKSGPSF